MVNPLGVDRAKPAFSWKLFDSRFGARQTAYRIIVSTSLESLAELRATANASFASDSAADNVVWDSGKVVSDQSIHIAYCGKPLVSREQLYWQTQVWDANEVVSPWSEVASFEIGLIDPNDWQAAWVEAPAELLADVPKDSLENPPTHVPLSLSPLLRSNFVAQADIRKARVYCCGLGYHELFINGAKVGPNVLDPAQTDYLERALYVVHDVTSLLRQGDNAIGLWLGNGWFNQTAVYGHWAYGRPCGIVQLEITYTNGTVQKVVSDRTWKVNASPIVANNVHLGETYDARKEQPQWATAKFDATGWVQAVERASPTKQLQSQRMPAIQAIETIPAIAINEPRAGEYVVDLGQNFSGWVSLKVNGESEQTINLRFAETLTPDGRLDQRSTGIFQADRYICNGAAEETWEPRFTYHGFRYVELTGLSTPPTLETITGIVVHSAVTKNGSFRCSDPLINRIHQTALWTQRSNLHGVPTDCPHRERCGWLGDAHVAAEMMIFNYDVERFLSKYLRDIRTSLIDDLMPRYVAPGQGNPGAASADWASAIIQLPWYLYLYYGDKAVIEEHYDMGSNWLRHVRENLLNDDLILPGNEWGEALGDWCPPGGNATMQTSKPLTSTAYVYYGHVLLSKMAAVLEKPDDAKFLADFAGRIRTSFNREFYDHVRHTYGTQTANTLALYTGLAPEEDRALIARQFATELMHRDRGHHTTGILGSRYLFGELSRFGFENEALSVLQNEDYPSIGWLFKFGATTLWENWADGIQPGDPMPDYSLNQPMQGGFDAWFYDGLCGIQPDPDSPGFKHFHLRPCCPDKLQFAEATHDSPYGMIESGWRRTPTGVCFHFKIPPNCTATFHLPHNMLKDVTINGIEFTKHEGLIRLNRANGSLHLRAGEYILAVSRLVSSEAGMPE